ncbi:MAG TPA: hypothetical protein VFX59_27350 [Polyangiales bacterium]|nr:hypothetical protein [Polyangiales bacterium]
MSAALRRTLVWTTVPLLIVLVCGLDSSFVEQHFAYGPWAANVVMLIYFAAMYRSAPERLRGLMKYGVVIATAGEALFSLVLHMYEYRHENIPIYVPPGHAVLYGAIYYFVREPAVLRARHWLTPAMLAVSIGYAGLWYTWHQDLYGALCTALFVVLVALEPDSRLFFLAMFILVGFLEQVGTRFECWFWWQHAFDKYAWLPSGNPPSGISVFYFAFDVLCLRAYLRRRPRVKARLKRREQLVQISEVAAA